MSRRRWHWPYGVFRLLSATNQGAGRLRHLRPTQSSRQTKSLQGKTDIITGTAKFGCESIRSNWLVLTDAQFAVDQPSSAVCASGGGVNLSLRSSSCCSNTATLQLPANCLQLQKTTLPRIPAGVTKILLQDILATNTFSCQSKRHLSYKYFLCQAKSMFVDVPNSAVVCF